MSEHEPQWQREQRLQREADRQARMEERLDSIYELLQEERKLRVAGETRLADHLREDEDRFRSLDSRLTSFQSQLTPIGDSLRRIEQTINGTPGGEPGMDARLKRVERFQTNWTVGWQALAAAAGVGASIATVVAVAVGLL